MPTQTEEWILMAKLVSQTYSKADAGKFFNKILDGFQLADVEIEFNLLILS